MVELSLDSTIILPLFWIWINDGNSAKHSLKVYKFFI
jgi:hypothetical protein